MTPLTLPFDTPYWLGTQIGGDPELVPRVQLGTAPYSFFAATVADSAVTTPKLADAAVTSEKILDGTIDFSDVAPNSATMWQVMKWNGAEWVADDDFGVEGPIAAIYGDAGLTGGGDHGIVPISIAEEGVEESMLQADAVTSGKIEDGTILFGDLGQNEAAAGQVITWSGEREGWESGPITGEMIGEGAITMGVGAHHR